jgi:hypothetical protein
VLIEDSFSVRAPVERLWPLLHDVERIAPCLPGAELTEVVDDRTWKGTVHVRFGPVQMAFSGTVVMEERDDREHRVRLSATGTEHRNRGAARASVGSWLEPSDDGATTVHLRSDITLTGAAAQLSRGLLPEVSRLLTRRFAECLQAKLVDDAVVGDAVPAGTAPEPTAPRAATPGVVGGIGLALRALWRTVTRFLARSSRRRGRP